MYKNSLLPYTIGDDSTKWSWMGDEDSDMEIEGPPTFKTLFDQQLDWYLGTESLQYKVQKDEMKENPLIYFALNDKKALLVYAAVKLIARQESSAAESMFSDGGYVCNDYRSSLLQENISAIVETRSLDKCIEIMKQSILVKPNSWSDIIKPKMEKK